MTAAELIEILKSVPPDTPIARTCGGDCIGYDELRRPRQEILYPNPEGESAVYAGQLFSETDYQTHMRCEDSAHREGVIDYSKTYPLPEGKSFLVF